MMTTTLAAGPMLENDGPWTLGVKIGLPFALVFLLICVVIAVGWIWLWAHDRMTDWSTAFISVPVSVVILFLAFGGILWTYWPLDSSYHQYRAITGNVDQVSSRIIADGDKGSDEKFVVRFIGSPQQYAINDTRASLLKHGDKLTISCKREFEYGSEDGYDCRWGRP